MLILTIVLLILLALFAYRASGNLLFPGVIFSGTWALTLAALWLSGDTYFPISVMTNMVYLLGAAALCTGSLWGARLSFDFGPRAAPAAPGRSSPWIYRVLELTLLLLLIGLPLFWEKVLGTVADASADALLHSIRAKAIESSEQGNTLGLIGNFVVLSQFVAVMLFYEMDSSWGRRLRAVCAVCLALVYGAMTGTKGNAIVLMLSLFFIYSIKRRRIGVGMLLGTIGVSAVFFLVGLFLINFVGTSIADMPAMLNDLVGLVRHYWLGGCVAFDQIVDNPEIIESTRPINRFFLETARSLGMAVYVPPLHADYLMISPVQETNVYTIYFTYFKDFGWYATLPVMSALGALLGVLYNMAMRGGAIAVLMYATMCVALVMSVFIEQIIVGLNIHIKFLLLLFVVYKVIPAVERWIFLSKVNHV